MFTSYKALSGNSTIILPPAGIEETNVKLMFQPVISPTIYDPYLTILMSFNTPGVRFYNGVPAFVVLSTITSFPSIVFKV